MSNHRGGDKTLYAPDAYTRVYTAGRINSDEEVQYDTSLVYVCARCVSHVTRVRLFNV